MFAQRTVEVHPENERKFLALMENSVDIDRLAKFACIRFSEEEKVIFLQQLQDMIGYCSKLEAIDTEGIEPLLHPFAQEENVWGEDDPTTCDGFEMLVRNAAEMRDGQLVVPKVL